jgi:DNA-binding MarR family transcriptional regulator
MNLSDRSLLPVLPCACANLRRAARAVTRIYNQELRTTGLELTQYTLLMALDITGESTQGELGRLLALDSTTLTRMLAPLKKHGWIGTQPGKDRRQRLLRLSASGRRKLQESQGDWTRAQVKLRQSLGETMWNEMQKLLTDVAGVSAET